MSDKTFNIVEENAKNAPVQNINWEGKEVETEGVPLTSDDTGKPIIMRVFTFKLPPLKEEEFPTAQQFINVHKTKLTGFLWRDELVPIQEFKCIFSKDKSECRIFATCQAKAGSTILERPQTLQHTFNKK
jgi:hypothetical protein